MESYVIRIYRKASIDELVGSLIRYPSGNTVPFHSLEEMVESLKEQLSVELITPVASNEKSERTDSTNEGKS